MKFCEECGAQLEDEAVFCEECGASVAAAPSSETAAAPAASAGTTANTKAANNTNTTADNVASSISNDTKSKGGIIALCIVLLLALGGAGIYFSGILGTQKPESQNTSVNTALNSNNTAEPSPAETAAAAEPTATPAELTPTPVPAPTVAPTPKGDNSYLLPKSDKKYYKESELAKFSKEKLRLARNEIFARHGYIFKDKELLKYFKKKAWYQPKIKADNFSNDLFNKYEKKNIELISALENGNSLQKGKKKWEGYYENDTTQNAYSEFSITITNVKEYSFDFEIYNFMGDGGYGGGGGIFENDNCNANIAYLTIDGMDYMLGYSGGSYYLKTVDNYGPYEYYDLIKY